MTGGRWLRQLLGPSWERGRLSGPSWEQRTLGWLPYLGAVAVYAAIRIAVLGSFSQAPQSFRPTLQMLEGALALTGQHAKLFFWPAHLSAFRTFELGPSLHSPWTWLTPVVLLATLVLRKREPILTFLTAWWAVTLLPCLDIRLVGFPVADRFSYLPSVGLCLALGYAGLVLLPKRWPGLRLAPATAAVLLVVASAWAVKDVMQVRTWHTNEALWTYSVQASPDAALPHLFQATLFQKRDNNLEGAEREYRTALRLNRLSVRPLVGLAYECYLGLGQVALPAAGAAEDDAVVVVLRPPVPAHDPGRGGVEPVQHPCGRSGSGGIGGGHDALLAWIDGHLAERS